MNSYRAQLVEELNLVFKADMFGDIVHMLSQGGYCLEIAYDVSDGALVPIAFVFDNKFLRTRLDLALARKSKKMFCRPSRREMAEDLLQIYRKLLSLYDDPQLFTPTCNLMRSTMESMFSQKPDNEENRKQMWWLIFTVDGVNLAGLSCEREDGEEFDIEVDDPSWDIEHLLRCLPNEAPFLKLTAQRWYPQLSPSAQLHVRVGTTFVERGYLDSGKEGIEDYSPLLLSFVKATESEITEHFQKHATALIRISEQIVADFHLPSKDNGVGSKTFRELKGLVDLAVKIVSYKMDYSPSGTLPLYYFLKFYALRTSLDRLDFKSYLSPEKTSMLSSLEHGLDWLKNVGYNRNELIHERIVDSEHEFLMHYDGIVRVLNLLVRMK